MHSGTFPLDLSIPKNRVQRRKQSPNVPFFSLRPVAHFQHFWVYGLGHLFSAHVFDASRTRVGRRGCAEALLPQQVSEQVNALRFRLLLLMLLRSSVGRWFAYATQVDVVVRLRRGGGRLGFCLRSVISTKTLIVHRRRFRGRNRVVPRRISRGGGRRRRRCIVQSSQLPEVPERVVRFLRLWRRHGNVGAIDTRFDGWRLTTSWRRCTGCGRHHGNISQTEIP